MAAPDSHWAIVAFTAALVGALFGPIQGGVAAAAVAIVSGALGERTRRALQRRLDELEKPMTYDGQRLDDLERRRRDASARSAEGDHRSGF
jgi:uncharacterized protein (DUF697 family)